MNPDFNKMVNEMVKPMVLLSAVIITGFAIAISFQLLKDINKIYRRLGKETADWLLKENKK